MQEYFRGFQINLENYPLPLPGVYRYTNLIDGKSYVGISQNIAKRDHGENTSPRKFRNAIKKHGRRNFIFEPLFYWTDNEIDKLWLKRLEAELIISNNSIKNGYNIMENDGAIGPYGAVFSEILRAAFADPISKTKQKKSAKRRYDRMTDEEKLEFHIKGATGRNRSPRKDTPETIEKRKQSQLKTFATPEFKITKSQSAKRVYDRMTAEEKLEFHRRAGRGMKGKKRGPMPEWHKDKLRGPRKPITQERKNEIGERVKNEYADGRRTSYFKGKPAWNKGLNGVSASIWINNGERNSRIKPGEPIPEGWMTGKKKSLS